MQSCNKKLNCKKKIFRRLKDQPEARGGRASWLGGISRDSPVERRNGANGHS